MNSKERREKRYVNRQRKRQEKFESLYNLEFEDVLSFEKLCDAGKDTCKGVRWKGSTIDFETKMLSYLAKEYHKLKENKRDFKGFSSFKLIEHGKEREINALLINERAYQKSITRNLLLPVIGNKLIYDNSASLTTKGMDFFLKRLKKHLRDHYRKYRLSGGIYKFDFKSYFASIPHDKIKELFKKYIKNEQLYNLICNIIDDFQLMVCSDAPDKYHGIGLGSEISQVIALCYVNKIDHYVKEKYRIKGYGRYMDDGYIISDSLETLKQIKKDIYRIAEELGIKMNNKKNIIIPFKNNSFTFLKFRISITNTGKIILKLNKKSIRAMIRKMNIFRKWLNEGTIKPEDIFTSYQSWRSHARRCNSYNTLRNLDKKFIEMFREELRQRDKPFPCTIKAQLKENGWSYLEN